MSLHVQRLQVLEFFCRIFHSFWERYQKSSLLSLDKWFPYDPWIVNVQWKLLCVTLKKSSLPLHWCVWFMYVQYVELAFLSFIISYMSMNCSHLYFFSWTVHHVSRLHPVYENNFCAWPHHDTKGLRVRKNVRVWKHPQFSQWFNLMSFFWHDSEVLIICILTSEHSPRAHFVEGIIILVPFFFLLF